ncbi:MAG: topoisomerase DNA-binding C4 zinc finger domain-containing protein, partial [Eggerthellaceae bacterium]|nr:topoisomerase DNA-binding C4 zinc finger domain-containing protein [Eggerthellaceae bacterium]
SDYCNKLLAGGKLHATRGNKEETDHPPIYPTAKATPDDLPAAEYKLYNLVARRFLATPSDAATVEGTKVTLEVPGESTGPREQFVARGDVTVKAGFRAIYPYGLKKDEQLPALEEGALITFNGAKCTKKQTEPPARYSQGKLIQEMEKLGLGTKSTRHSIIERLYTVKYIQNDPIEPSQLGMAVIDALDQYAPHITHPEMTSELEDGMSEIAAGTRTKNDVVMNSRNLLAKELEALLPMKEEVATALADAVAADAYVGTCPKCGKDLQIRASQKTHGMFIGCSGWPECDVTYPLPKGKIEAQETKCPTCGMPQVKVSAFRATPRVVCIDPNCSTNSEPDVVVGICPTCTDRGVMDAKLIAQRNPRTLKRFIRCEHYDICETSYPLPQYGELTPTEDVCEACGAPMVIIKTARGPWKLCPNFDCPSKEEEKAAKQKPRRKGKSTRKKKQ